MIRSESIDQIAHEIADNLKGDILRCSQKNAIRMLWSGV